LRYLQKMLLVWVVCVVQLVVVSASTYPCQYSSGGYGWDLTPMTGIDYSGSEAGTQFLYKLNLCGLVTEPVCYQLQGSMCQYNQANSFYHVCGTWAYDPVPIWSALNGHDGVVIELNNGDGPCPDGSNRLTVITLHCDPTAPIRPATFTVVPISQCGYGIDIRSSAACPVTTPSGLSGGWIFILILVVAATIYIAVGCGYKRHKKGLVGMESFPNIDFWRQLPVLVKEGCLFTWSKCRGQTYEPLL